MAASTHPLSALCLQVDLSARSPVMVQRNTALDASATSAMHYHQHLQELWTLRPLVFDTLLLPPTIFYPVQHDSSSSPSPFRFIQSLYHFLQFVAAFLHDVNSQHSPHKGSASDGKRNRKNEMKSIADAIVKEKPMQSTCLRRCFIGSIQ